MGDKTAFYIDGFNLYHSLKKDQRWLDLFALVNEFKNPKDSIETIKYFSAYCPWDSGKEKRHRNLVTIYEDLGITVVLGKFKKITRDCRHPVSGCSGKYKTHEEKQTDVNIALHLINDAWNDLFDKAYIVSADTDLLPAIRIIIKQFPEKKVNVIFPPNKFADEIKSTCLTQKIKNFHLDTHKLQNPYTTKAGVQFFAPHGWI